MDILLRRLSRVGFRRGLTGDHWAWLVVAGSALLLQRAMRSQEPTHALRLKPGDRILITMRDPGDPGGPAGSGPPAPDA